MSDFFSGKKQVDSIRQAPNLANLLCKSKFMPVEENFHVNSCRKSYACCPYLRMPLIYWKERIKFFFEKGILMRQQENLIYVVIVKAAKNSILVRLAVW